MKVLIINSGSAEEIIFSTVFIRALKVQLDQAIIHILTNNDGAGLLGENPYVDEIMVTQNPIKDRGSIKALRPDTVFDLDNTLASRFATFGLARQTLRFDHRSLSKWLLTRLKINKLSTDHLADQYLALAKNFGLKEDALRLDYFVPYKDEVPQDWLPQQFQGRFVAFCISAPYTTRKLPVQRMIELCDKMNKPVILLGKAEDEEAGRIISEFFERHEGSANFEEGLKELGKKTIVYNACGKFNLHQQASLIKRAQYVFTFDSEYLAIASAFGKEIFSLWGNTVPTFGKYPYLTKFTLIENTKLSCRPCSVKGYSKCPLKHFKCMNDVVFDFYLP